MSHGIDSHDLLHLRTFLDHNRPYTWLAASARGSRTGESTAAFVYRGALLGADEMEKPRSDQYLVEAPVSLRAAREAGLVADERLRGSCSDAGTGKPGRSTFSPPRWVAEA